MPRALGPQQVDRRGPVLVGSGVTTADFVGSAVPDAPDGNASARQIRPKVKQLHALRCMNAPATAMDQDGSRVWADAVGHEEVDCLSWRCAVRDLDTWRPPFDGHEGSRVGRWRHRHGSSRGFETATRQPCTVTNPIHTCRCLLEITRGQVGSCQPFWHLGTTSIMLRMEAERALAEVFVVPIESACTSAVLLLSPAERLRLSEMRNEAARNEFVSLRACLRSVLSERLGCAPQSVAISVNPGGPPVASGSGWHFSLSHASTFGVVALSRTGPIGVDMEADHQVQDAILVARTVLHPSECEWICSHHIDMRSAAFLRLWVRKEAVAKASGQGLAMRLDSWSVLTAPNLVEPCVDVEVYGRSWRVLELTGPAGHFVALATGCLHAEIHVRQLPHGAALGRTWKT